MKELEPFVIFSKILAKTRFDTLGFNEENTWCDRLVTGGQVCLIGWTFEGWSEKRGL